MQSSFPFNADDVRSIGREILTMTNDKMISVVTTIAYGHTNKCIQFLRLYYYYNKNSKVISPCTCIATTNNENHLYIKYTTLCIQTFNGFSPHGYYYSISDKICFFFSTNLIEFLR